MRAAVRQHLVTLATIAVAVVFTLGVYLPQSRQTKRLRDETLQLKSELASQQTKLAGAAQLYDAVQRSAARQAGFDRAIPPQDELGDFLENIDQIARQSGLGEMNVVPSDVVEGANLNCHPIEMNFRGDLAGIYGFLRQIESLPRIVRVQRLELGSMEGAGAELAASLTVHVYYRRS